MNQDTKETFAGLGIAACVVSAGIGFVLALLFSIAPIGNSLTRWNDYWHYESRAEKQKRMEHEPRH